VLRAAECVLQHVRPDELRPVVRSGVRGARGPDVCGARRSRVLCSGCGALRPELLRSREQLLQHLRSEVLCSAHSVLLAAPQLLQSLPDRLLQHVRSEVLCSGRSRLLCSGRADVRRSGCSGLLCSGCPELLRSALMNRCSVSDRN
jgi:hypothetical protein